MVTRRRAISVATVMLLLVGVGGYLLASGHLRAGRSARKEPATIISPNAFTTNPSLAPTSSSLAARHDGLRIKLPELKVDLPVVEGDGYDAPLYKAAHYPGMPWPGEGGRSLIYAHARTGMFGPLFSARVAEHVEIVAPDGSSRKYVIKEYYPRWPVTDIKWLRPADHEQLVLLTCTTYNYNDPRIVAVSEPE